MFIGAHCKVIRISYMCSIFMSCVLVIFTLIAAIPVKRLMLFVTCDDRYSSIKCIVCFMSLVILMKIEIICSFLMLLCL